MEEFYLDDLKVRIAKLFTDMNICSRTQTESWVDSGYVKVNGKVLEKPQHKVNPTDFILIDKKAVKESENQVTVILNKPINYVSSFNDPKYEQAVNLITKQNHSGAGKFEPIDLKTLGVVGRLDAASRGLLIYTQDGSFAKSIIGEQVQVEKEYIVRVKGKVSEDKIQKLCFGLSLDGKKLKRARVTKISANSLNFILVEGKNRQIRRMCGAVNLEVTDLQRIRISNIKLPKYLKEGQWEFLKISKW